MLIGPLAGLTSGNAFCRFQYYGARPPAHPRNVRAHANNFRARAIVRALFRGIARPHVDIPYFQTSALIVRRPSLILLQSYTTFTSGAQHSYVCLLIARPRARLPTLSP